MNKFKMKVKKRLTDELARIKSFSSDFYKGEREGINFALYAIDSIDEPEKPVVPQYVADWYEGHKRSLEWTLRQLGLDMMNGVFDDTEMHDWLNNTDNKPFETLVKMKLYGYEVEKEKFYTAQLKSTGEYLHYDSDDNKFHHTFAFDAVAKSTLTYHFTKDELVKYHAWENDYYDVNEVKE